MPVITVQTRLHLYSGLICNNIHIFISLRQKVRVWVMTGKLRNMTSIYLLKDDKVLLLFRKGGKVVSNVWTGSAGGHFEEFELNDAKACVLREMNEELGLREDNIRNLSLRYVTLRRMKGEIRQIGRASCRERVFYSV